MLNAPRQLLQSGVRAVETITASGMTLTLTAFADFGIHCRRVAPVDRDQRTPFDTIDE
jgi:hypothetical protein